MGDASDIDLRSFLLEHVEDLEEFEILLCLYEHAGDAGMNLDDVTAAVRVPSVTIRSSLERLAARGLISCTAIAPAVYRFDAPSADREAFSRVAAAYRDNPLEVMRIMTSIAVERVRTAAVQRFADCFRFGGPKTRG